MAYLMSPCGNISICVVEDGEVWVGAWKAPMDQPGYRMATPEEVAADNARRDAEIKAIDDYMRSFGITDFGPNGPKKQPKEYAAMVAYEKKNGRPIFNT